MRTVRRDVPSQYDSTRLHIPVPHQTEKLTTLHPAIHTLTLNGGLRRSFATALTVGVSCSLAWGFTASAELELRPSAADPLEVKAGVECVLVSLLLSAELEEEEEEAGELDGLPWSRLQSCGLGEWEVCSCLKSLWMSPS